MPKGKFFVLEGMDGSGKATQTKLLTETLIKKSYKVEKVDFPQYGKGSAALLELYLNGGYGTAEEIGPYRASIFYACDRYDAGFKIGIWMRKGKIFIKDKKEWQKYVEWLANLEYNIFKIPKPDCTFILKISLELSMKMSNRITDKEKIKKRTTYLGDSKQ